MVPNMIASISLGDVDYFNLPADGKERYDSFMEPYYSKCDALSAIIRECVMYYFTTIGLSAIMCVGAHITGEVNVCFLHMMFGFSYITVQV